VCVILAKDLSFTLPGQSILVFEADWHEKLLQGERRGKGCIGNTFQFISIADGFFFPL
jgi:hypothetical protein